MCLKKRKCFQSYRDKTQIYTIYSKKDFNLWQWCICFQHPSLFLSSSSSTLSSHKSGRINQLQSIHILSVSFRPCLELFISCQTSFNLSSLCFFQGFTQSNLMTKFFPLVSFSNKGSAARFDSCVWSVHLWPIYPDCASIFSPFFCTQVRSHTHKDVLCCNVEIEKWGIDNACLADIFK